MFVVPLLYDSIGTIKQTVNCETYVLKCPYEIKKGAWRYMEFNVNSPILFLLSGICVAVVLLQSLFFPPDLPARANFAPDSEANWASLAAWMPLFSMTGVIGWMQLHRRHWLKKMLWILLVMAFVPGLNAMFQLMNASYYARWFYMLTLMMSAATMMSLENAHVNWKRSIKWTALITVGMSLVIGLMPKLIRTDGEITSVQFGLEKYPTRFWCYTSKLKQFTDGYNLIAFFLQCRYQFGYSLCSWFVNIVHQNDITILYTV